MNFTSFSVHFDVIQGRGQDFSSMVQKRLNREKTEEDGVHGFSFARNEFFEKQAARIKTELDQARQEERQKMMEQLNWLRETTDQQLNDQREQYEMQLKDLSKRNEDIVQVERIILVKSVYLF
ncbi:Kinesin-like protein KIF14 [Oopsacas minuta]|uniref:Kinesin-like protein KIF14 n=1 Tax=Oopsacas minuta TaxID=111878 RepID=A0AAV7JJS2_9METZ|nr:Kinesin-like protein KIF14 [Oopsacas minuta]